MKTEQQSKDFTQKLAPNHSQHFLVRLWQAVKLTLVGNRRDELPQSHL